MVLCPAGTKVEPTLYWIYNLYAMLKYAIFFLVLLSGALAKSKTCKATPGKSSIKGKEFFQWQASKYWNQGPIPSYDPLKNVLENGERECRKTCEKSRPRSRCAAWEFKYSGSSSGGTSTCNLYEAGDYEVKTDSCSARVCTTGVCK